MLVLSRREGEAIRLGDDILVTVVRITSQAVRIGIVAPPEKVVVREELIRPTDLQSDRAPPATREWDGA